MECHCPHLVYVPVVAFRLEPKDGKGVFAVDGELLIGEAVKGQVLPNYFWMVSGYRGVPPSLKPQPCTPPRKSQQRRPQQSAGDSVGFASAFVYLVYSVLRPPTPLSLLPQDWRACPQHTW